jgi:hypothetical protein
MIETPLSLMGAFLWGNNAISSKPPLNPRGRWYLWGLNKKEKLYDYFRQNYSGSTSRIGRTK